MMMFGDDAILHHTYHPKYMMRITLSARGSTLNVRIENRTEILTSKVDPEAGHHNPPPRPRDRHFLGCILP